MLLGALMAVAESVRNLVVFWQVLYDSLRGVVYNELGHESACHGHDRKDRDISLVRGADEAHPSVLLRFRPATLPQAQEICCRLVHVDDAGRAHFVLHHVAHQAQSELVHVRVQQLGVLRFLSPA